MTVLILKSKKIYCVMIFRLTPHLSTITLSLLKNLKNKKEDCLSYKSHV